MIQENVLAALYALGLIPEEIEGLGYGFECEGLSMIYAVDDEDAQCINLIVPDIFDISEDNRIPVLETMVKLCRKIKFVQPHIMFEDQVWLNYQHYLGENEVTTDLIEHMIRVLSISTIQIHHYINGNEYDD